MEVYILILFLSLIVAKYGNNKGIYWCFFLILMFFSTFRGMEVGGDTAVYQWAFSDTEAVTGSTIKSYEFGYLLLNLFVFYFIQDYTFFLGVTSFLVLFPIFYFTPRYSKNYNVIVSFYVLLYNYNFSLCFVRQFIAISILYVGYLACASTHKKKYLVIAVLIATLFHQSSIAFLILLLFVNKRYNRNLVSLLIVLSYFVGRLNIIIPILRLFGITSFYSGDLAGEMVFTLNGFIMTIYFAYIAYICDEESFIMYTMMIGLLAFNVLVFNTNLSRLNWSLSIVQILILGNMKLLPRFQKNVKIHKALSYVYAITLYIAFLVADQGKILPYTFSFE